MDKLGTKPLYAMTRMDAIRELQQSRAELKDARQKIKDLQGWIDREIERDTTYLPNDVRETGRIST